MRLLPNIFKRNRQIERLKALNDIFRFSRSEDIAKAYELGRIEALSALKTHLWSSIIVMVGILGAVASLSIYFFIPSYIDSKVDSRVEREIDKRIDRFSRFYAYTEEVLPVLEYDFYKIQLVETNIRITNNQSIERLPVNKTFAAMSPPQLIQVFRISAILFSDEDYKEFIPASILQTNYKGTFGLGSGSGYLGYRYFINSPIDIFENFNYLWIKIFIDTSNKQALKLLDGKPSDRLDEYINSVDEISIETHVNKISLFKKLIKRDDLKKSGDLEYSFKINWRDIFKQDGSARRYYLRLAKIEKEKFNFP